MEIRYFQIIVPIIAIILIINQLRDFEKNKSGIFETIILTLFWFGIAVLALFPDYISDMIAKIFGIKSNINAIIFLALGMLFYFQFKLYKIIKSQDDILTELARKIALDENKKS